MNNATQNQDNQNTTSIHPDTASPVESKSEVCTPNDTTAPDNLNYQAEMVKYKDQWLRAAAEVENIKRRTRQEVENAATFSIERFSKDLIGVLENLYRAADAISEEACTQSEILRTAKEGIDITKKEMLHVFEKNGIRRIHPEGEKFNHHFHQAVAQVESTQDEGSIVEILQAGYVLKDRLLRPAMVTVSKSKITDQNS